MSTYNLFEFFKYLANFLVDVYNSFLSVWQYKIVIGDFTFSLSTALTTAFIVLLGWLFIKKFIL